MKYEFTANLHNHRIKVRFNYGQPLWFWSGYKYKRYIPVPHKVFEGEYGMCVYTTLVNVFEIEKISHEQFSSFRLHGLIMNGQVCVCNSTEVPFFLMGHCDWSSDLRDVLIQYMGINVKFREYILSMLEEMEKKCKMDRRLISLSIFFKSWRKKDYVLMHKRMEAKKLKKKIGVLSKIQIYLNREQEEYPDEDLWWIHRRNLK